jgi:hypothetical protein
MRLGFLLLDVLALVAAFVLLGVFLSGAWLPVALFVLLVGGVLWLARRHYAGRVPAAQR